MIRLAAILFSMIGTTFTGSAIVIALTMGLDTLTPILVAAAIGFLLAIPATWVATRKIATLG